MSGCRRLLGGPAVASVRPRLAQAGSRAFAAAVSAAAAAAVPPGARVLIVGAGNMGGALARGLARRGAGPVFAVAMHDVHAERLEAIAGATDTRAVRGDVGDAELRGLRALVLCVKPQDLAAVGGRLAGRVDAATLVVSILAGVPMADVAVALRHEGAVRAPRGPCVCGEV